MADNSSGGWEDAPKGANSLSAAMYASDANLQAVNPNWPTGGTQRQLGMESNFNSNARSPKGAMGMAQVMPDTLKAVEEQTGRKLDPNNVNDALLIHRYVMAQNLQHFGDVDDSLRGYNSGWDKSKWDNPETNGYVNKFNTTGSSQSFSPTAQVASNGWEDAPTQGSQPNAGWEDAQPSAAHDRIKSFLSQAQQNTDTSVGAVQGAGEAAANMASGGVGMIAGGLHSLYDLATGQSDQATADIARDEAALTYQPRTPQGQQFAQKLGQGFGAVQNAAEQGAVTAMGAVPFIGDDLAKNSTAVEAAKTAADVVVNVGPMLFGAKGAKAVTEAGKGIPSPGAAGQLDAINTLTNPETPAAPPPVMEPNAGPHRPIIVDSAGNATPAGMIPDLETQGAEIGRSRQMAAEQQAAGDLFPNTLSDTTGQASSFDPNRLAGDTEAPTQPGRNMRQGEMDFDQPPIPDTLISNEAGETGTPSQLREGGAVDVMKQRIAAMQDTASEVLDPTSGSEHPTAAAEEAPRSLAPDEFVQAVESLAEKDPSRFSIPGDMERAYQRYTDIVRDDTGALRSKSKSAASFADAVRQEMQDQRLDNHPTIKANQARVDGMAARLADAQAKQAPTQALQRQLDMATKTLEKSRENIGRQLADVDKAVAPYERDGVVHMYTFGHLPTMMKSIGAILKALHGVAFKTLDRMVPKFRSLDSSAKIFGQGLKDYVNKQANREWTQTVNQQPVKQLSKIDGLRQGIREYNPYEGQEISPAELKLQMQQAPDISGSLGAKLANNVIQGGLQMTNLTKHPLVKFATETVDRAMRNARNYVKNNLTGPDGLRTKMQTMSSDELTGIRSLMELNEGVKEFTPNELKNAGLSAKQIDYYKQSLIEDRQAFDRFNNARAEAGLKPVDRRIAHIAGYFMGDFRRIITDKEDKVVAVIAHNFRPAVETITKRFLEDHPDASSLNSGPIQLRKLNESIGSADNRFHGYMEVLNSLKDTNADVGRVVDAYQNYITKDAQAAMGDRAKFKSDVGVLGAEGRKAWQSATQNALEGSRQQLHYLESINKWAEMQEAISKTKGFLSDPEINAPNAKALSQDYLDSVQGRNRGPMQKLLNGMMNGVAEMTGIGPSVFKNMNNVTKSAMLMKFVGIFKLSHSAVTLIQPLQALPALNARISARGADLGAASITSVGKALSSSFNIFGADKFGKSLSGFEKRAYDYMQTNGTADVGMSAHLENVTKGSATTDAIRHIGELNVRIPEQGARTFTYMYYAHMLKELGLPEKEVFGTAHNLMRDAMVDYSPHERSLIFGKMGVLGDIASTLTRFKYNQIGQHMVGFNDFIKGGSAVPLMTTVLASVLAGGVRGVFAYEAANQVVDLLSTGMAKMNMIKQPTSLNEMILYGLHGVKSKGLADMINFGAPAAMGVNMTGSLTNADTIPVDPIGALFPTGSEFANLANAAGTFMTHPNKNTAQRAGQAFLPNSMKGAAEDAFFTKDNNYYNPNTGKLQAHRSDADEYKRAFSFRPLNEAKDDLVANVANNKASQLNSVKQTVVQHAYSDMVSQNGQLTPDQAHKYVQRYIELGGDPQSFVDDLTKFKGMDQHRTPEERAAGIPSGDLSSISKYQRVQGMK